MKLSRVLRGLEAGRVAFWCPGCNEAHAITITGRFAWSYNDNPERPTFTPSILVKGRERLTDAERARVMAGETVEKPITVCHSFVADGQIQYLGDCTHALAGQTVPLPDFDGED